MTSAEALIKLRTAREAFCYLDSMVHAKAQPSEYDNARLAAYQNWITAVRGWREAKD